jgi:hypothetical protein
LDFQYLYSYATQEGTVHIACGLKDLLFHIIWNNQSLGSYEAADIAAEEAATGAPFKALGRAKLMKLDISPSVFDWIAQEPVRRTGLFAVG